MRTILAKFKVGSVTDFGNNNQEVKMTPVTTGSEENKSFSLYTPSGDCRLHITNPGALDFFHAADKVYVEFKKDLGYSLWNNDEELKDWLTSNGYQFKVVDQIIIIPSTTDPWLLGLEYGRYQQSLIKS